MKKIKFSIPLILLSLLFIFSINPLMTGDEFNQLAIGREITANHNILSTDIFTFTRNGTKYIYHEWLFSVFSYLIYLLGHYKFLILVKSFFITGLSALIFYVFRKKDIIVVTLTVLIWIILSKSAYTLRPHILSFYFYILLIYLLQKRKLTFIPLIMIFWANIHGSFILGIIAVFIFFLFDIIFKNYSKKDIFLYILTFIIPIVNPNGIYLYLYPFQYIQRPVFTTFISEWMPPQFEHYIHFYIIMFMFYIIWIFNIKNIKKYIPLILISLITSYLSIKSVRHISYAVITYMFILILLPDRNLFNFKLKSNLLLKFNFLLIFTVIIVSAFILYRIEPYNKKQFPDDNFLYYLHQRPEQNIICKLRLGCFFMWQFYPQKKVFINGSVDLFDYDTFRDYLEFYYFYNNPDNLIKKYNIEAAVFNTKDPLSRYLHNQVLYKSGDFCFVSFKKNK